MYIADDGIIYRYLFCPVCQSIRLHSLKRREIRKVGTVWWVRYATTCYGIAPLPAYKRRKLDTPCRETHDRWVLASEWNALCLKNAYAA